jgi:hypothetical protein
MTTERKSKSKRVRPLVRRLVRSEDVTRQLIRPKNSPAKTNEPRIPNPQKRARPRLTKPGGSSLVLKESVENISGL